MIDKLIHNNESRKFIRGDMYTIKVELLQSEYLFYTILDTLK